MTRSSVLHRLHRLEDALAPDRRVWSARSREILRNLDERPVTSTALRYASRKALRRLRAGAPPLPDDGRRTGWTPYFDHTEVVDHDQPVILACREAWHLVDLAKNMPFKEAVAVWLAEADQEGWPELEGHAMTPEAFWRDVRHGWRPLIQYRGLQTPEAAEWRRRNPSWRPDLSEDELIAFDIGETDGG